ncbi:MAG: hypothetical protein HYV03_01140 [Deltaproteobacteria bacterium]|nr:hypothetical protein [Deltaproteobacteria bacterium]
MARTTLGKELEVRTTNQKGQLAKVTGPISEARVNITGMAAIGQGSDAYFWFVTSDNTKAREVLTKAGLKVEERDVCCVELDDRPGTAFDAANRLAGAGLNIDHWYFSSGVGSTSKVYFSCDNCQKATQVLGS